MDIARLRKLAGLITEQPVSADDSEATRTVMAYDAVQIIKDRGEIGTEEWARALVSRHPQMQIAAATAYIDHIVNQFRGIIKPAGGNNWRYEEQKKTDTMDFLRNIVKNPKTS